MKLFTPISTELPALNAPLPCPSRQRRPPRATARRFATPRFDRDRDRARFATCRVGIAWRVVVPRGTAVAIGDMFEDRIVYASSAFRVHHDDFTCCLQHAKPQPRSWHQKLPHTLVWLFGNTSSLYRLRATAAPPEMGLPVRSYSR